MKKDNILIIPSPGYLWNLFLPCLQEICSLKHVIEVRENKLVEVSKENIDLQETCAVLRRFAILSLYRVLFRDETQN